MIIVQFSTVEIPINGKIRVGTNPCKGKNSFNHRFNYRSKFSSVCTCTATGFTCQNQCETNSASTSMSSSGSIYL